MEVVRMGVGSNVINPAKESKLEDTVGSSMYKVGNEILNPEKERRRGLLKDFDREKAVNTTEEFTADDIEKAINQYRKEILKLSYDLSEAVGKKGMFNKLKKNIMYILDNVRRVKPEEAQKRLDTILNETLGPLETNFYNALSRQGEIENKITDVKQYLITTIQDIEKKKEQEAVLRMKEADLLKIKKYLMLYKTDPNVEKPDLDVLVLEDIVKDKNLDSNEDYKLVLNIAQKEIVGCKRDIHLVHTMIDKLKMDYKRNRAKLKALEEAHKTAYIEIQQINTVLSYAREVISKLEEYFSAYITLEPLMSVKTTRNTYEKIKHATEVLTKKSTIDIKGRKISFRELPTLPIGLMEANTQDFKKLEGSITSLPDTGVLEQHYKIARNLEAEENEKLQKDIDKLLNDMDKLIDEV